MAHQPATAMRVMAVEAGGSYQIILTWREVITMEERYDVFIYEKKTGVIEAKIGDNLSAEKASIRIRTGESRINSGYRVLMIDHNLGKKEGDTIFTADVI